MRKTPIQKHSGKRERLDWLALWLQKRRRRRTEPAPAQPNAPVITGASWVWGATEAGKVDVTINFTFDAGVLPVGTLEIFMQREGNDPPVLVGTVPSNQISFTHVAATDAEEFLYYSARYVSTGVTGPMSAEYEVMPTMPPAVPGIPLGLNGGIVDGNVVLTWSMDGVVADGVSIEARRVINGEQFAVMGTTGPSDTTFQFDAAGFFDWQCRVRSFNAVGFSDYSDLIEVMEGM